jgi:hypothetical protein
VWAQNFNVEQATEESSLQASFSVDVTDVYHDAVLATNGVNTLDRLESSLKEAIGRVLELPAYAIDVFVSSSVSGRRQMQTTSRLSVGYEVICSSCAVCAAASGEEACLAAAGDDALCVWASSVCAASLQATATTTEFAAATFAAFIYSASTCCPTVATSGASGPPVCAATPAAALPSACASGPFGSSSIVSTIDSIAAGLPDPLVVTVDAADVRSLTCAEDQQWPADDQSSNIEVDGVTIDVFDTGADALGCIFDSACI